MNKLPKKGYSIPVNSNHDIDNISLNITIVWHRSHLSGITHDRYVTLKTAISSLFVLFH